MFFACSPMDFPPFIAILSEMTKGVLGDSLFTQRAGDSTRRDCSRRFSSSPERFASGCVWLRLALSDHFC